MLENMLVILTSLRLFSWRGAMSKKISLASEIKKQAGTELAELLSELKYLRAKQAKGHNQKVVYMIDTTTQIGGKLYEAGCGFSPCFFGSLKECESAIR